MFALQALEGGNGLQSCTNVKKHSVYVVIKRRAITSCPLNMTKRIVAQGMYMDLKVPVIARCTYFGGINERGLVLDERVVGRNGTPNVRGEGSCNLIVVN